MTPQAMGHLSQIMASKIVEGVKLRSIMWEKVRDTKADLPAGKNVERKLLSDVPIIALISEKEASVSFPKYDRNVDFPSFFGSDPTFLKWVNDLYLHYWEQAKIWY
jgi:predicted transcriptional regulator